MITRCSTCHRPMKPTESGRGPKCEKKQAAPLPELELFRSPNDIACEAAAHRVVEWIKSQTWDSARVRLGVWAK